jgi:hypothetical protein
LLPLSVLKQSAASLLVEQAIQPVDAGDGLVLVLNTQRVGEALFGSAVGERAA